MKLGAGVSARLQLRRSHAPCHTHTDTGRHRSDWTSQYPPLKDRIPDGPSLNRGWEGGGGNGREEGRTGGRRGEPEAGNPATCPGSRAPWPLRDGDRGRWLPCQPGCGDRGRWLHCQPRCGDRGRWLHCQPGFGDRARCPERRGVGREPRTWNRDRR